eukprot:11164493-Lingulodinium_polyedra.AAC.1
MARVRTEVCLADCITKHVAKPDVLLKAVSTGILPGVDTHPSFRTALRQNTFVMNFLVEALGYSTLDATHSQFM